MKSILQKFSLLVLILTALTVQAQDSDNQESLKKTAKEGVDIAYAEMIKGELVNIAMNHGQLCNSYFRSSHYNCIWPKSKGAIARGTEGINDFAIIFAHKGNVVDCFSRRNEDWSPVEGHLGHYHAKNQPDELKISGYPHLAASDLPATWPEGYFDENGTFIETPGEHHWPGRFRVDLNPDSPTYLQEVPGEFPADRVVYWAMDDRNNLIGEPMGIRLDVQAYEYGRPYAADFHFFDITITNTSDVTLDSCWYGYYNDLDYGDYKDEALVPFSTGLNPGPWDGMMTYDPDGCTTSSGFESGVMGYASLKTVKDMGITDSHRYLDIGPTQDEQLWPIITSNPNDPNCPLPKGDYFHGSNVHYDDYSATLVPPFQSDWVCMETTGPFTLEPGESVRSVLVILAGSSQDDFMMNVEMAKSMFEKYYQGPSGPVAPKLYAVPGDQKVTLYWDDLPERLADPFSNEFDFEGYRIYRSQDKGQTWGEKNYDGSGAMIGYLPVKFFDLKNDIIGLDPVNPNSYLGDDSGISHSWVDSVDIYNGVEYSYTVTAYDRGDEDLNLPSFESPMGASAREDNFATVTPGPKATGFTTSEYTISHVQGPARGSVELEILDPLAITDHTYQVVFADSPAVNFGLVDGTTGDILMDSYPVNTDHMPGRDGFSLRVNGDEAFFEIKSVLDEYGRNVAGSANTDTTGSWYVNHGAFRGDAAAKSAIYEIRFTSDSSVVASRLGQTITMNRRVPFQVWNVSDNRRINAIVLDAGNDLTFSEGERIYLVNTPYEDPAPGDQVAVDLLNEVPVWAEVQNAPEDTLNRPPLEGQLIEIAFSSPHTPGDRYEIHFNEYQFQTLTQSDLDEIRVVPNPYIVNAAWETAVNVRSLRFMYLPPRCSIKIFTTRGEHIKTLEHDSPSGTYEWNLVSESNQDLAFGMYIYIVTTPDGHEKVGKFALIK